MNERIRELAKQAGFQSSDVFGVMANSKPIQENIEKFAELIVRECGKWVNDNLGLLDEEAEADLLKHFGVEQ